MYQETPLYKLCLSIAEEAHEGQTRHDKKTPYIEHPKAVVAHLASYGGHEALYCAAILHDSIEDSAMTAETLRSRGVPPRVVELVVILSRKKDESYFDYLMRVLKDEEACEIKFSDLHHNLSDLDEGSLKDKYRLAQYIIRTKLKW